MNLYNILINRISDTLHNSINEMASKIDNRTIDRKLWLSVASVISRNKSTEAEFIKPMKKLNKFELLDRYVAGLIISKKPCPNKILDISDNKTLKLLGLRAIELGATILDILELYIKNGGKFINNKSNNNIIPDLPDNTFNFNNNVNKNTESSKYTDKIPATVEWMEKAYKLFNEMYFDNSLPLHITLAVKPLSKDSKTLGMQSFSKPMYMTSNYMSHGKYVIFTRKLVTGNYRYTRKGYEPIYTVDKSAMLTNIMALNPSISISSEHLFTENELEDTMIHEMIHLWTFIDNLAPKLAHGTEFKTKAIRIQYIAKNKYGKIYELGTYATNNDASELTLAAKKKLDINIRRNALKGGGIYCIYIKAKPKYRFLQERFLFCTANNLKQLVTHIRISEKNNLLELKISNNCYIPMSDIYGKFSTMRTYRFWYVNDYPKFTEIFNNSNVEDILNVNESKKPYVKPEADIIQVPANTNLSEIDILNIVNNSDKELKDEERNILNIIDPEY